MSAITAKASRKMKKYAVLTREPRCFLGSFDFSWEQRKFDEVFDCTVPNNTLSRAELSYDEGTVLNVHYGDVLIKYGSVLDVQKDDIPRIPHRCREDFNGALLQDGDVIIADTAEDETTGKACEIGNLQGSAIVSGLHTMVCRPRNRMALGYLGYYLNSNAYHHQLLPLMQGIKVLSLSRSNIQKTSVSYPIAVKEQQLIAYYFSQLDNLITLHQRKCVFLFGFFQAVISMIFTASTFSWEQRKLNEVVNVYDGVHQTPDYKESGVMFLSVENISTLKSEKYISEEAFQRDYKVYPQKGDILMTRIGDVGTPNVVETTEKVAFYVSLALLKPTKINSYFLCNSIQSPLFQKGLKDRTLVTAIPQKINKDEIGKVNIILPTSSQEQQLIGEYFANLDRLITLHQRECISFTARAGRRILTANKKRNTSSWEQRKLGEVGTTYTGLSGKTKEDFGHGNGQFVTYMNVFSNPVGLPDMTEAVEIDDSQNKVLFGDVLFTTSSETPEEVGMSSVWLENAENTYLNSFCFGYRSTVKFNPYYLAYMLRSSSMRKKITFLAQGISRYNISKNKMMDIEIPIPNIEEQKQIGAFFKHLDKLITLHQRQPFFIQPRIFL